MEPSNASAPARDHWQHRLVGQGLAYRFLARCFHEPPTEAWLRTLVEGRLFDAWPLPSKEQETADGLKLLRASCHRGHSVSRKEIEWDFNRLFVGPGEMLAPPWESVHRSKTGLTFQDATLEVRRAFQSFGLQGSAMDREPDDHLAFELAFVAHLSEAAAAAGGGGQTDQLARCLRAQTDFLEDHLLVWAPNCLALVVAHAETDYYRGTARLTLGSLRESARMCAAAGKSLLT